MSGATGPNGGSEFSSDDILSHLAPLALQRYPMTCIGPQHRNSKMRDLQYQEMQVESRPISPKGELRQNSDSGKRVAKGRCSRPGLGVQGYFAPPWWAVL